MIGVVFLFSIRRSVLMFIVLLRFAADRSRAGPLLQAHVQWLQQGFDDGVFALAGSLPPQAGGAILAHGLSRADLERRLQADPFVAAGVVRSEIVEVAPAKAAPGLEFLLA
ncbi:YciI family protein [Xanthomonas sacchari]|nr:YciI family protein [Xanthomonas sacchari]